MEEKNGETEIEKVIIVITEPVSTSLPSLAG